MSIRLLVFRFAFVAALVVITYKCLTPMTGVSGGFVDKLYHLGAYGALAILGLFATSQRRHWKVMLLGLVAYGMAIEIVQPYFGRSFEIADWIADSVGVFLGLAAVSLFRSGQEVATAPDVQTHSSV